jgi:hypothetical protein
MNPQCKRVVMGAAIIGFVVPIGWGLLELLFFNAHDSLWTTALLVAARVTCPPWLLNGFWGDIGSPLLNAVLYGVLALLVCAFRSPDDSSRN